MERVLSIIVPAYNVESYLEKTLNSCEVRDKETQKQYEVIIVNDGSGDRTRAIAQKYVRHYEETKTFKIINKENGGYGSAINAGLAVACGEYIKILDGDDWYNTEALEKLILFLADADGDAILTDYTTVNECTGESELCRYRLEQKAILNMKQCQIPPRDFNMHGICYKTSVFREHNIKITEHCFYTDTEFLLYPLPYVDTIQYYQLDLYQYRVGREGQSVSPSGIIAHISDQELLLEKLNAYFDSELPDYNKELVNGRIAIVYDSYIRGLLISPCCRKNYNKLKEFIRFVKGNYSQRYKRIVNKKVILLEDSGFFVYWFCCMWHRKIECRMLFKRNKK